MTYYYSLVETAISSQKLLPPGLLLLTLLLLAFSPEVWALIALKGKSKCTYRSSSWAFQPYHDLLTSHPGPYSLGTLLLDTTFSSSRVQFRYHLFVKVTLAPLYKVGCLAWCPHNILFFPVAREFTISYHHILGSLSSRKLEAPLGQVLPLSCSFRRTMAPNLGPSNRWMNGM